MAAAMLFSIFLFFVVFQLVSKSQVLLGITQSACLILDLVSEFLYLKH